jgi:protein phosphatase
VRSELVPDDGAQSERELGLFREGPELESIETFHPWIAVLLNVSPDHLDRHPSVAAYTAAYSVGFDLFVVHIGDSRAYLFHDGDLRRLTRDHTLAQRLADQGAIAQDEVETHPQRHVLTRVVGGTGGWFRAEIHHTRLEPGDAVLVCTDGLTNTVADEEIAEALGRHATSEKICDALLATSLERGAPDNVTMIVARYREAG